MSDLTLRMIAQTPVPRPTAVETPVPAPTAVDDGRVVSGVRTIPNKKYRIRPSNGFPAF